MCQRDARVGWNGKCRTNAGHYFKRDAGGMKRFGFLAAASKEKRVATLEPHDALSCLCLIDKQTVDLVLRGLLASADFADVDAFGGQRNVGKQFRVDKIVVDHHIA